MAKNNGTLPTRTVIPLSTTNPKTLISTRKPTVAATKRPTKKPIASKKGEDKDKDEDDKDDKKNDKPKNDQDSKYNINTEGVNEAVDKGEKEDREKVAKIERLRRV